MTTTSRTRKWVPAAVVLAATLGLAACGSHPRDRAISGAGIGAASGAIAGALIPGLSVLTGAAVGAGVGAVTGAATTDKQVDFGKPAWQ